MNKKIPYGQSNFADLIESGYAYVDKTRYIELLENENNRYQFLIRPRRFGKSLFLSVLENYYDLKRKEKFNLLFKELYIGKNPTAEHGIYAVIQFDFSGLDTDNQEAFKKSFSIKVQEQVVGFLQKYKSLLQDAESKIKQIEEKNLGIAALGAAFTLFSGVNIPIYVIIDEYDHFANNLIAMGKTYINEVKAGGIVRSFYELLKTGTKSVVRRIFITGISPMMLNDLTSGFNISTDYSLFSKYNDMFGFTKEEVDWLMNETGVNRDLIKVDMEDFYNGYMFNKNANNKVYNSQMILYVFNHVIMIGEQPENIVDTNLQTDYERLRRLAENEENQGKLLEIVKDGGTFGDIIEKFSLEKLHSSEYFVSLLFYMGMLTNGGVQKGRNWLKIPNYSIRTLYWEYAINYIQNLETGTINKDKLSDSISKMAYDGDYKSYFDFFVENILIRLSNRDLINFDEKYIKVMLLSTLFISNLYLPISEDETTEGYTDIYLIKHPAIKDIKYEYIFEIKYIKTEATEAEKNKKIEEAKTQVFRYKTDPRFTGKDDIIFLIILFKGKKEYEIYI